MNEHGGSYRGGRGLGEEEGEVSLEEKKQQ